MQDLYREGLFHFDYERAEWLWDLAQMREMDITDNVVELMIGRIRQVSDETQEVLQNAACIGDRFHVRTLAAILAQPPAQVVRALGPAVQLGLVVFGKARPLENRAEQPGSLTALSAASNLTYQFLHDRVQQAAYSLIAEERRPAMHLAIGRVLLSGTAGTEREDRIFDIVNHLNAGAGRVELPAERLELAWLNLAAGRKAKARPPTRQPISTWRSECICCPTMVGNLPMI